ncbi:Receptor-like kinase [Melia azedarach]|uniref:Receptor-like kinase n=1 Tax=Melia azedarach TaxID=155640 RepID=A0ACC1XPQ3_MELAZ|nr:Receptor-like kinase [Melia azedarach]
MKDRLSPRPILDSIITIFCILIAVSPVSHCRHDEQFVACSRRYTCGSGVQNVGYPFWGGDRPQFCGRGKEFELKCQDNQFPVIDPGTGQKFRVLKIDPYERKMTLSRVDLWDNFCPGIFNETAFDFSMFYYSQNTWKVEGELVFIQTDKAFGVGVDQFSNLTKTCNKSIRVPVQLSAVKNLQAGELGKALKQGFDVEYHPHPCSECESSGGVCGSSHSFTSEKFVCFCHNGPQAISCPGKGLKLGLKLVIGVGSAGIGLLTVIGIIIYFLRWKTLSITPNFYFRKLTKDDQDLEAFIRNYGPLAPKRRMDKNSLTRLLALARTSHVNVVTLLGFCLEGSKRALIYEFMSNGSLEKFIYNRDTLEVNHQLGWEKLYQIAIEIARGLEYLHRGCNTRILHLDIKPHNILLDEEFCPKISDFGPCKTLP